jgi:hypothetical protein
VGSPGPTGQIAHAIIIGAIIIRAIIIRAIIAGAIKLHGCPPSIDPALALRNPRRREFQIARLSREPIS